MRNVRRGSSVGKLIGMASGNLDVYVSRWMADRMGMENVPVCFGGHHLRYRNPSTMEKRELGSLRTG